jgi:hypothetical protein
MDNFKWQPAASPVVHGENIPIGHIDIFIGYVNSSNSGVTSSRRDAGSNDDTIPIDDNLSNVCA